jgi:hypothetical protein
MGITRMTLLAACILVCEAGCSGKNGSTGDADADVVADPPLDQTGEADAAPDPVPDPTPEPADDPVPEPEDDPDPDPVEDPAVEPEDDPAPEPEDDPVLDPTSEPSCVGMGCPTSSMGLACCSGLRPETGCEPGATCSTSYCVDCGDGACRSHETAWNCPTDCPSGCTLGTVETTVCPGTGTLQCTCVEDPCKPYCDLDGTAPDGWIDPCTGTSIASCTDVTATARCLHIGTRSEGWYEPPGSGGTSTLIDWDFCANRWSCVVL